MEELAKIGFTYDVTQFSPEGEEVSHQVTKNLITNQGIQYLYSVIFSIKYKAAYENGNSTSIVVNETATPIFLLGFIENNCIPNKNDLFPKCIKKYNFTTDLWDQASLSPKTNYFISNYYDERKNSVLNGEDRVLQLSDFLYVEKKFRVITGFFLLYKHYYSGFGPSSKYSSIVNDSQGTHAPGVCLLSAAQLPSPVQMVPNGTLKIKTGFTLISS